MNKLITLILFLFAWFITICFIIAIIGILKQVSFSAAAQHPLATLGALLAWAPAAWVVIDDED